MADLMLPFCALVAMAIMALMSRRRDAIISAGVVCAVWVGWVTYISLTQIYAPWPIGMMLDGTAAWLLLLPHAGRGRIALSSLYLLQCAMHIGYGLQEGISTTVNYEAYDWWLDAVAIAQIVLVGGWSGGVLVRRHLRTRSVISLSTRQEGIGQMEVSKSGG